MRPAAAVSSVTHLPSGRSGSSRLQSLSVTLPGPPRRLTRLLCSEGPPVSEPPVAARRPVDRYPIKCIFRSPAATAFTGIGRYGWRSVAGPSIGRQSSCRRVLCLGRDRWYAGERHKHGERGRSLLTCVGIGASDSTHVMRRRTNMREVSNQNRLHLDLIKRLTVFN